MTSAPSFVLSLALSIALFAPQLARAQTTPPAAAAPTPALTPQESSNKAREAFQKANVHYALGEFAQAAELYQDAYKLKPDPALLYNAAQSFRLAGNAPRALVLYKNYLLFYPSQRNVPEVKQQVINLQNAIATAEKAQSAPPTSTAQPREPEPAHAAAAPQPAATTPGKVATTPTSAAAPASAAAAPTPGTVAPAPAPTVAVAAPTPRAERAPVYKKWWFWVATVGGAVLVAGGVTAGVVLSRRASNDPAWATTPAFGSGAHALNVSQLGVSW